MLNVVYTNMYPLAIYFCIRYIVNCYLYLKDIIMKKWVSRKLEIWGVPTSFWLRSDLHTHERKWLVHVGQNSWKELVRQTEGNSSYSYQSQWKNSAQETLDKSSTMIDLISYNPKPLWIYLSFKVSKFIPGNSNVWQIKIQHQLKEIQNTQQLIIKFIVEKWNVCISLLLLLCLNVWRYVYYVI